MRIIRRFFRAVLRFIGLLLLLRIGWSLIGCYVDKPTRQRAAWHADEALAYCKDKGYRTDYCLLVDFNVQSGRKRFFIWSFKKDRIVFAGICAHGKGGGSSLSYPKLSNMDESSCSCVGRFELRELGRINRKNAQVFGHKVIPRYALKGLDPSCSRASHRCIYIHPSFCQLPSYPIPLLHQTEGCFGTSWYGFLRIWLYARTSRKSMLLWAYK